MIMVAASASPSLAFVLRLLGAPLRDVFAVPLLFDAPLRDVCARTPQASEGASSGAG